jgi:hypothetical protein
VDKDFIEFPDDTIKDLVNDGLDYLTKRVGFWRQQNPIYSRPKTSARIAPRMHKRTGTKKLL